MLECLKFESVDWHKVKVTSTFHQTCRLLIVDTRQSSHRIYFWFIITDIYIVGFYCFIQGSYTFADADTVKAVLQ